MPLFAESFTRATFSCVHFEADDQPDRSLASVVAQLAERGFAAVEIGRPPIQSKADLLRGIAQALRFPAYFGGNWDALVDCLRDMGWWRSAGYALFVHNAADFWAQQSRVAGTLVEVWLLAAELWAKQGVPFHLVFLWAP